MRVEAQVEYALHALQSDVLDSQNVAYGSISTPDGNRVCQSPVGKASGQDRDRRATDLDERLAGRCGDCVVSTGVLELWRSDYFRQLAYKVIDALLFRQDSNRIGG